MSITGSIIQIGLVEHSLVSRLIGDTTSAAYYVEDVAKDVLVIQFPAGSALVTSIGQEATGWSLSINGSVISISSGSISNNVLQLSFSPALTCGDILRCSYDDGIGSLAVDGEFFGSILDQVTQNRLTTPSVSITTQPVDQIVSIPDTATFTVAGTNIDNYQWRVNNTLIAGATNANYTTDPTSVIGDSSYDCIVANACGSLISSTAVLTVIAGNFSADSTLYSADTTLFTADMT